MLRVLDRWMRMIAIPNQSSVAKAYEVLNADETMMDSFYRHGVVNVVAELMRFTLIRRDVRKFLMDRYRERKQQRLKVDLKRM